MIAIHHSRGSYSERWISYCDTHNIAYKIVDCYASNIVDQLKDCDAIMWHHSHINQKDILFAKQLLFSLQQSGMKVFPDFNTGWHFNDKLGQKYLLEAINVPHAPSYVFFTKKDAFEWIARTIFPKVFKLRSGASSANVMLVHSATGAMRLTEQAFGKGFSQYNAYGSLRERFRMFKMGMTGVKDVVKGLGRFLVPPPSAVTAGKERGYIYFQDFIEGNDYDLRVIVISNKAYAIKRMVRKNDFRASGSGVILYGKDEIDIDAIRLSFEAAKKINSQCLALDIVFKDTKPLVLEISYGVLISGYDKCPGYWDSDLNWHEIKFNPYGWIIEDMLKN